MITIGTKRIGDLPPAGGEWAKKVEPPCYYPGHDPPTHQVFAPGIYEHTCDGCGKRQQFIVHGPLWNAAV